MKAYFSDETIVAVSTGTSEKSALGIIRISGFEDLDFIKNLFHRKREPKSHKAYYCRLFDDENDILDEGVFTYFKAPKSFTGENTLEITVHGNPFNLERIVSFIREKYGFRMAEPGEFSYRALKNNKLNLTQVEGLDVLLNASSAYALNSGLKALNNELHQSYMDLRSSLLELKASVELLIDFSEDVGEEGVLAKINKEFASVKALIDSLHDRTKGELSELLNPTVSLIGPTNAGKSTFFNKLLGKNRAIVSDIHGTTRDYISEYFYLDGQAFRLVDTAGLREGADDIEKVGIERSLEINKSSFFKVLVINPFEDLTDNKVNGLNVDAVVLTHSDLEGFKERVDSIYSKLPDTYFFESGPIGASEKGGPIGPKSESGPMGAKSESGPIGAKFMSGPIGADTEGGPIGPVSSLEELILSKYQVLTKSNPITIQRHRHVISSIYTELNKIYFDGLNLEDAAILSHHVNLLSGMMDELIGIVSPQEVLDHIFANFCIGK